MNKVFYGILGSNMEYIKKITATNRRLSKFFEQPVSNTTMYLSALVGALVMIAPLLFARVSYVDDLARQNSGYYDWGGLGRFATEWLMKFLTASSQGMADMGVQMQLLSIPVLAAAGILFAITVRRALGASQLTSYYVVGALLVVTNPFLLANTAFRFDSLSMVAAYMLQFLAFYLWVKSVNSKKRYIVTGLALFGSASLYQPFMTIFLALLLVLLVVRTSRSKGYGRWREYIRGVVLVGAVSAIYFATVKVVSFSLIQGPARSALITLDGEGFRRIAAQTANAWRVVLEYFSPAFAWVLFMAVAVLVGVYTVREVARKSRDSLLTMAVLPVAGVFSLLGPFVLLDSPLTQQVRTLATGFILIMLIGLAVGFAVRWLRTPMLYVGALTVLFSFNFSTTFAHSLYMQRSYDKVVLASLMSDIERNSAMLPRGVTVLIGGSMNRPSSVDQSLSKRPLLKRMNVAGDNSAWYVWHTLNNYKAPIKAQWFVGSKEHVMIQRALCQNDTKKIAGQYYSIYSRGDVAIVWLGSAQMCAR